MSSVTRTDNPTIPSGLQETNPDILPRHTAPKAMCTALGVGLSASKGNGKQKQWPLRGSSAPNVINVHRAQAGVTGVSLAWGSPACYLKCRCQDANTLSRELRAGPAGPLRLENLSAEQFAVWFRGARPQAPRQSHRGRRARGARHSEFNKPLRCPGCTLASEKRLQSRGAKQRGSACLRMEPPAGLKSNPTAGAGGRGVPSCSQS